MKEQLDRIESEIKGLREDVKGYAKETATNTADLKWVKRGIHGLGTILTLTLVHLMRKLGIPFSE